MRKGWEDGQAETAAVPETPTATSRTTTTTTGHLRNLQAGCRRRGRAREAVAVMADRKDFFRRMAVQYRQLAEIAGNPEIKQRMLDMAAHYEAKADEHTESCATS